MKVIALLGLLVIAGEARAEDLCTALRYTLADVVTAQERTAIATRAIDGLRGQLLDDTETYATELAGLQAANRKASEANSLAQEAAQIVAQIVADKCPDIPD